MYNIIMGDIEFVWDEKKNKTNVKKHGISFGLMKTDSLSLVAALPISSALSATVTEMLTGSYGSYLQDLR